MKLRIVGHLRLKTGFHEKEIELDKPTILRSIISFPDVTDERLVVLINDIGGSLNSIVLNQDFVKIMPVVGGG